MKTHLDEALTDCLDQVRAGLLPAQALARHSDVAVDLAPLLALALAVRDFAPAPLSVRARSHVLANLAATEDVANPDGQVGRLNLPTVGAGRWLGLPTVRLRTASMLLLLAFLAAVAYAAATRAEDWLLPGRTQPDKPTLTAPSPSLGLRGPALMADRPVRGPVMRRATPVLRRRTATPESAGNPTAAATRRTVVGVTVKVGEWPLVTPTSTGLDPQDVASETVPPPIAAKHRHEVVQPPSPASPAGTSTVPPTSTGVPSWVTIGGWIRFDDGRSSRPLGGVQVLLVRVADVDCVGVPLLNPMATTASLADGHYTFPSVPAQTYFVGAEGGPECLARRWHNGPREPSVAQPCSALQVGIAPGQQTDEVNILFDGLGTSACPTATPTP